MKSLTFREEVGPGAVLADVEVLPQLAAGFKSEHGVVVQAVVPEQNDASRLQHLKATCVLDYNSLNLLTCKLAKTLAATLKKFISINLCAIYLYTR